MNEEGVRIVERGKSQDHVMRGGVWSWNEEDAMIVEIGRSWDHRKRKGVRIM